MMLSKNLLKRLSSIFILGGVAFVGLILYSLLFRSLGYAFYIAPLRQNTIDLIPINLLYSEQIIGGFPIRLRIPKIKVNTTLEYAGVTPAGRVGVPKSPAKAAWFDSSPRPGDIGNSIITGHYGYWKNGMVGAFTHLSKLRKGDKLYVEYKKGEVVTFVVREIRDYNPNADAAEVFDSYDKKSHLNLITCEGIWNKVSKSYSKRLVIFADREEK